MAESNVAAVAACWQHASYHKDAITAMPLECPTNCNSLRHGRPPVGTCSYCSCRGRKSAARSEIHHHMGVHLKGGLRLLCFSLVLLIVLI